MSVVPPSAKWWGDGWKIVRAILRILLGGLLIYSGVLKAATPLPFADSVASFRLLPEALIDPMALGLPLFEILLGTWLVCGWRRRQAAFCALSLTVIFLLALSSAFVRGIAVDCGCFGGGSNPLMGGGYTAAAIGRDCLLAAVAAFLYASALREQRGSVTG